ncbi:hypothetical protein EVAR_83369_1 [Eumeta japonica]|uniref:Uncharacterized protein n=1 Tax=Eumeta variegata TaxID=151549 RepID=A0A4C1TYG5_EUMVA|nr:hypothetical protein EVAR_83369_1 [Eumeta japonica]
MQQSHSEADMPVARNGRAPPVEYHFLTKDRHELEASDVVFRRKQQPTRRTDVIVTKKQTADHINLTINKATLLIAKNTFRRLIESTKVKTLKNVDRGREREHLRILMGERQASEFRPLNLDKAKFEDKISGGCVGSEPSVRAERAESLEDRERPIHDKNLYKTNSDNNFKSSSEKIKNPVVEFACLFESRSPAADVNPASVMWPFFAGRARAACELVREPNDPFSEPRQYPALDGCEMNI